MSEAFDRLVADYRLTCPSIPTQYEGTLTDGRIFYFHYRFGRAELGFGQTLDDAAMETIDPATPCLLIGEEYDGELAEDEFKQAFVELTERRAEGHHHGRNQHPARQ